MKDRFDFFLKLCSQFSFDSIIEIKTTNRFVSKIVLKISQNRQKIWFLKKSVHLFVTSFRLKSFGTKKIFKILLIENQRQIDCLFDFFFSESDFDREGEKEREVIAFRLDFKQKLNIFFSLSISLSLTNICYKFIVILVVIIRQWVEVL